MMSSADIIDVITAILTAMTVLFAFMAYRQSIEARRNSSFDAIFTQLLASFQGLFSNDIVKKTRFKQVRLIVIGGESVSVKVMESQNVFLNFCNVYRYCYERKEKQFTVGEICKIWKDFSNALVYESDFLICFKYVYHTIETISSSELKDLDKKQYIGIVQAQLNLDVLFCYLINQIAVTNGKGNDFTKFLRSHNFFKNLYEDNDRYGNLASESIPSEVNAIFIDSKCEKVIRRRTCWSWF